VKSQLQAIKSIRKTWGFNPVRVVPDKTKLSDRQKQKRLAAVEATHGIWKNLPESFED